MPVDLIVLSASVERQLLAVASDHNGRWTVVHREKQTFNVRCPARSGNKSATLTARRPARST